MSGGASSVPDYKMPEVQPESSSTDRQIVLLLTAIASFILLLLAGGLGFTVHEFQRLSAAKLLGSLTVKTQPKGRTKDATATLQRVS